MPRYSGVGYPSSRMTTPTAIHELSPRSPAVLIVDDDEYVHGALVAALRGLRVRLLTADTAEEGERLALANSPVLAIVDVGLPDRNGYQLTADLRRVPSLLGMKVLILTGQSPDQEAAIRCGADGLIGKPFRLHAFLDIVREQLGADHGHVAAPVPALARGA
jgi:DNA-binding response OmpR family regulator